MQKSSLPSRGATLRRGFTLIELLVVIAIISVLIALLLPAVQQSREAARRAQCKNNLAQVALAILNYEMAHEVLPPGSVNPQGPIESKSAGYHMSWTVQILPMLDQEPLYRHFDFSKSVYDQEIDISRIHLSMYDCPSDPAAGFIGHEPGAKQQSNYAGCHNGTEAPIDSDNKGVLFLNSAITFRDIKDGSTNTLLVGEKRASKSDLGWYSGTRATLRNAGSKPNEIYQYNKGNRIYDSAYVPEEFNDPRFVGSFGSFHPGLTNVAMGDGSVRAISENIDLTLFQRLAERADGKLIVDSF